MVILIMMIKMKSMGRLVSVLLLLALSVFMFMANVKDTLHTIFDQQENSVCTRTIKRVVQCAQTESSGMALNPLVFHW